MNLVDTIMGQFSGDAMSRISSMIGEDQAKTKSAVGAVIPAILAGVAGKASTPDGASKLASGLGGLDLGSLGSLGSMLGAGTAGAAKGGGMLEGLLGGPMLGSIAETISKFTGIAPATVKTLIGALGPVVLGSVASQFKGKAMSGQGLADLLGSQKNNILGALPSGLNLGSVPGLSALTGLGASAGAAASSAASSAAQAAGGAARAAASGAQQASSGLGRLAVPILLVALVAFLLWWFVFRGRGATSTPPPADANPRATTPSKLPPEPNTLSAVKTVSNDVTAAFGSVATALAGVKDAASADTALASLKSAGASIESLKRTFDRLPEDARAAVRTATASLFPPLQAAADKAMAIPGVGEKLRGTLDPILASLKSIAQ